VLLKSLPSKDCAISIAGLYTEHTFSALTLLVGWQEGHLACKKTRVVVCWHGYLSEASADLHMTQLMPLPLTVSHSS